MCSRENEFKSILFSLVYFHAVVVERRKFGPQGWNRSYPYNTGDLTISVNVLFNYLEANAKVRACILLYVKDQRGLWELYTVYPKVTFIIGWALILANLQSIAKFSTLYTEAVFFWLTKLDLIVADNLTIGSMDRPAVLVWGDYVRWTHHGWLGSQALQDLLGGIYEAWTGKIEKLYISDKTLSILKSPVTSEQHW